MAAIILRRGAAMAAAGLLLVTACTMKKTEAPALTGPSELGTSIVVNVSPDVLQQDGASQSLVTVTARDSAGQPIRNITLRAEINVNGVSADFGSLSARNIVTDSNGKASLVYTAPPAAPIGTDTNTVVSIVVTPIGTDAGNQYPRSASIRLVPPGVVTPPNDLVATFTFSPSAPTEDDTVLFDATASATKNAGSTLTYAWDFGDGSTATEPQATHKFKAGSRTVTLKITDQTTRTGQTTQVVNVAAGARPTAAFTFSPNPAFLNQAIHFNATNSTAPSSRTIVSYNWDFGDGGQQSTASPLIDHSYTIPRTYVVTLTVTDSAGKTSPTVTQTITPQ